MFSGRRVRWGNRTGNSSFFSSNFHGLHNLFSCEWLHLALWWVSSCNGREKRRSSKVSSCLISSNIRGLTTLFRGL